MSGRGQIYLFTYLSFTFFFFFFFLGGGGFGGRRGIEGCAGQEGDRWMNDLPFYILFVFTF